MTMPATPACLSRAGHPKKRYASEQAAKRDLARSHRFRHRRWPTLFLCPGCHGLHLTTGGER